MFSVSITLPLLLASAAAASPLARRAYPPVSQAQAFKLVANVTDPSKDFFDPPVNNWFLTGTHSGAGILDGMLSADDGITFFVNGTGRDVSAQSTSIQAPPLPVGGGTPTPQGLQFPQAGNPDNTASVQVGSGIGYPGAGIYPPQRSAYPYAFAPLRGSFMVCYEPRQSYPAHPYPVRLAISHIIDDEGHEAVDIPSDCVEITFLAQCETLPALEGVEELNIIVEGVSCYEDVAAIDWSMY